MEDATIAFPRSIPIQALLTVWRTQQQLPWRMVEALKAFYEKKIKPPSLEALFFEFQLILSKQPKPFQRHEWVLVGEFSRRWRHHHH